MPNPDFIGEAEIRGRYNGNATAFPFAPTVLPTEGVINAQMVLVDWADLPGDQEEYEFYKKNAELTEEFWFMASEGKLEVNIEITDGFLRIPGSYADFAMTKEEEGQRYETRPKKQALYDAVAEVSDPLIDYTDTQIVFPGWPRGKRVSGWGPHEFNFDWNAVFKTNERDIYDIAGAGDWHLLHTEYSAGPWVYYVHEMGHMLGIPHQTETNDAIFAGLDREEYWWKVDPMNGFEIMAGQDGAIKTLSAWLRWLPGWLDDDQITCIEEADVENELYALNPINDIDGSKEALVIKLSDTKVIVVESRRWDERFDRPIIHSRDGIIAYVVDSTLGSAQGNQALLSPRDITNWVEVQHWRSSSEMDGNFCEGNSVDVAGINIKLESSQKGVDYVRVTSTNKYVDPETPAAGTARGEVNRISNGCVYGPGADRKYFEQQMSGINQPLPELDQFTQSTTMARQLRSKGGCSCCGCSMIPE
jgi:M6 family metalloprotease-like protein